MTAERARPSFAFLLFIILSLPAFPQVRTDLVLSLVSVPLIAAGQGLYWTSVLEDGSTIGSYEGGPDSEMGIWAGGGLSWLGAGLFVAGRWSASGQGLTRSSTGIPDLFAAPFRAQIMRDERVLAPLAAATAARIIAMKEGTWQDFFGAESRYFLGYEWLPPAALAARAATAAAVALGSAVASEALLRGIVLEKYGFASSVAAEAAIVVTPYLVLGPRRSDATSFYGRSDPALMTAELLFAAYSGLLASSSGDPRRSIALRFWLETVLSTLSYLEAIVADPDGPTEGLGFGLRLSY